MLVNKKNIIYTLDLQCAIHLDRIHCHLSSYANIQTDKKCKTKNKKTGNTEETEIFLIFANIIF